MSEPSVGSARASRGWLLVRATAAGVALALILTWVLLGLALRGSVPYGSRQRASGSLRGVDEIGRPVAIDRVAPLFSAPLLGEQGSLSLASQSGHVVVLNFWASWCTACRAEAPSLERLWGRYRPRGVRFIGVDHEDERSAAETFERSLGIDYPSVYDPGGTLVPAYSVVGLPTTFVIGPTGRIGFVVVGRLKEATLARAIDAMLGSSIRSGGESQP